MRMNMLKGKKGFDEWVWIIITIALLIMSLFVIQAMNPVMREQLQKIFGMM